MVEKINFAGLNENAFGDSDFIFMMQSTKERKNISRPLAQPVGVLRRNARALGHRSFGIFRQFRIGKRHIWRLYSVGEIPTSRRKI
jgi:hypothetical protein